MELLLALVLLYIAQVAAAASVVSHGTVAIFAMALIGMAQLLALWLFRHQCPEAVLKGFTKMAFSGSAAIWALICVAVVIARIVLEANIRFPHAPEASLFIRAMASTWVGWLVAVLLAPLFEEIVFRALLIELLRKKMRSWLAILVAAVIFAVFHVNGEFFVFLTLLGVLFGTAYIRSKTIFPSLIGHILLNGHVIWRASALPS